MDVLETAREVAKYHALEEQYAHTYRESVEFLNKRVEEKSYQLSRETSRVQEKAKQFSRVL